MTSAAAPPKAVELVTVDVRRDFSNTPGGRYARDGHFSAEALRRELLEPVLDRGARLVVDLDGPLGFTGSFLEETFGGLVRRYGPGVADRITVTAPRRPRRAEDARAFLDAAVAQARR